MRKLLFSGVDERTQTISDVAIKNAVIAMSISALSLGVYHERVAGETGIVWPIIGLVGVAMFFPLGRRLLSGGLFLADERTQRLQNRAFRWTYIVLGFGLIGYSLYRYQVLNDLNSGWMSLPAQAGLVVTLITSIAHGIDQTPYRTWLRLANIIFFGVSLGMLPVLVIVIYLASRGKLLLSPSNTTYLIGVGAIVISLFLTSLWAAWRRRRDEQEEQRERQSTQLK